MRVRPLIREVAEILSSTLSRGRYPGLVVVDAPTAYGKTTQSPAIYSKIRDAVSSYIHVLPMRAMVRDAYISAVNASGKTPTSSILREVLGEGHWSRVGYQAMALGLKGKSPFFVREIVYTTLHSFVMNIYRIPVAEAGQFRRHYELPRAYILNSLIVFDEAHLYGGWRPFMVALRYLISTQTPVVVESATMPPSAYSELGRVARGAGCTILTLRDVDNINRCEIRRVSDEDFIKRACDGVTWNTGVVKDAPSIVEGVVEAVLKHLKAERKVLAVLNTPEDAVKVWRELRRAWPRAWLVHGRMAPSERKVSLKAFRRCSEASVLVATQVIEAGVEVNSDAVVTAPATPSSLIQRAGRAARRGKRGGWVTLVASKEDERLGPYKDIRLDNLLKTFERVRSWRCPLDEGLNDLLTLETVEAETASASLVELIQSPIVGTDYLLRYIQGERGEGLCSDALFGPDAVVVPVEVEGVGEEFPVSTGTLRYLLSKGARLFVREGNTTRPLSKVCDPRVKDRAFCQCVVKSVVHGTRIIVPLGEGGYLRGEGLVLV